MFALYFVCVCKRGSTMHACGGWSSERGAKVGKVVHPGPAGSGAEPNHRFDLAGGRRAHSHNRSTLACPWSFATAPLTTTTMHYASLSRNQQPLPPLFDGAVRMMRCCCTRGWSDPVHRDSSTQPSLRAWPACWPACSCTTSCCSAD